MHHFLHDFWRKMKNISLVIILLIDQISLTDCLEVLLEILGNVYCNCLLVCNIINLEINLDFLTNRFPTRVKR